MDFDSIVPWGRSLAEYEAIFALRAGDLTEGVLDCGGGPASFTAELIERGVRAFALDPLYAHSAGEIRSRFEASVDSVMSQVNAHPNDWTWTFHGNPEALRVHRKATLERFLSDYAAGLREKRYVAGQLPQLPFADGGFGLAVCSHLLFLYSELLSARFHVDSALELCRVAREVRVFPLLGLDRRRSPHLGPVRVAAQAAGWESEIVRVPYELQKGGNEMLRIFRE